MITGISGFGFLGTSLAHRNCSDFCDLRLGCPSRTQKSQAISETRRSSAHALRFKVRWKVASDLRFRAAISEPETPSFCGISGDLAPSTRKSLAIAIVRFWCAKRTSVSQKMLCCNPIFIVFWPSCQKRRFWTPTKKLADSWKAHFWVFLGLLFWFFFIFLFFLFFFVLEGLRVRRGGPKGHLTWP